MVSELSRDEKLQLMLAASRLLEGALKDPATLVALRLPRAPSADPWWALGALYDFVETVYRQKTGLDGGDGSQVSRPLTG